MEIILNIIGFIICAALGVSIVLIIIICKAARQSEDYETKIFNNQINNQYDSKRN